MITRRISYFITKLGVAVIRNDQWEKTGNQSEPLKLQTDSNQLNHNRLTYDYTHHNRKMFWTKSVSIED